MNPGELRHRLAVDQPVETPDGVGGVTRAFALLALVWGRIDPLGGAETRAEDRVVQRLSCRITIRNLPGLTAACRFRKGARIFEIRSIGPVGADGRHIACLCEEIAP